jgi:small subunit ribosomal protein S2
MAHTGIRELLEAGVHFGHQTRRWNPRMAQYIHGERQGIYLIDLLQTEELLEKARVFSSETAARGGTVLFVGTKKQASDAVKTAAEAAGMPYVNHRWLGGLLTNFQTISQRIKRLHDLERFQEEGQLALLPTRERLSAEADLTKLRLNLGGVKNMQRVPDAVIVFDINTEEIAVKEANRLRIPVIGLVDTNCDPTGIDFVVPGNDDAMRSCHLIADSISSAVLEARSGYLEAQAKARADAEAKAAADRENREKREAEEAARRLAVEEEAAAKAAAQAAEIEAAEALRARAEQETAVRAALAERAAAEEAAAPAEEAAAPVDQPAEEPAEERPSEEAVAAAPEAAAEETVDQPEAGSSETVEADSSEEEKS